MKLCLSGTPVEAPQIRASDEVDVATKKVASILGEEYSSILLIYRGQLLSRQKQLADYRIEDGSILHVIVLEHPRDGLSPSTSASAECTEARDPSSSHNEEDYGESITSSLFVHIFGDVIQSCQPKEPLSVSIDDIAKTLEDDPSIVASAIQTPLFQDILSDLTFVRKLLLSNSMIQNIISVNPGLKTYIDDDTHLRDLIEVLSNSSNYSNLHNFKAMILQKLEKGIGKKLEFRGFTEEIKSTEKDTGIPIQWDVQNPGQINPWATNPSTTSERHCRDDHIALLCQIIAHRPDIVMSFMKQTPMYKLIANSKPGLLGEVCTPERLAMLAKPEMIRALIKVDKAILKILHKRK